LLRELSIERLVVVGTSLGGLMAMLMVAMRAQAFAGVVLNDIGPELDPAGVRRIQASVGRLPPVSSWAEAAAQMRATFGTALPDYDEAQWLELARRSFVADEGGELRLAADPKIGDAVRAMPPPPGATQAMWLAFGMLRSIPTLAIRGAHSDLLSEQTFARMQQEKPDLVCVTVPNRGHAPQLDEPQASAALTTFFERIA
jgi:pimeloyl-ACP methyl ester carboxylesterase